MLGICHFRGQDTVEKITHLILVVAFDLDGLWFWLSHGKLLNHLRYRSSIQLRTDGDSVFIFLCNDIVKGDLVSKTFGFFAVHLGFNICIDTGTSFQAVFFKQNRFQTKFVGRTGCDVCKRNKISIWLSLQHCKRSEQRLFQLKLALKVS